MRETLNVKTVKKEWIFQSLSRYRQVNAGKGRLKYRKFTCAYFLIKTSCGNIYLSSNIFPQKMHIFLQKLALFRLN